MARTLQLHGYTTVNTVNDAMSPSEGVPTIDAAPITLQQLFFVSVSAGVATWLLTRLLDGLFTKRKR